ncbi:MAG TPA: hypothetical protein DCO89_00300 [Clostridiales bacterium]|nr:hypothetical protein [Clostridiales bacterium]
MELNIIKFDYSVVIADISGCKKILLATSVYDKTGKVSAFDLQGDEYKLEPDLGGFNGKTGEGWLDYWMGDRRLECAYENLEVSKEMRKMGIKRNDMISMETLKKFEKAINFKEKNDDMSL